MVTTPVDALRVALYGNPEADDTKPARAGVLQAISDLYDEKTATDVSLQAQIDAASYAAGDNLTVATWSALSAIAVVRANRGAFVPKTDTGTHTDPVVGGTVANSGQYSGSLSPLGWKRIGNAPATTVDLDAAIADFIAAKSDLFLFQRIGTQVDPVAGTSTGNTNFFFTDAVENDGSILVAIGVVKGISSGGVVRIKHASISGVTAHHETADFNITVPAGSGAWLLTSDNLDFTALPVTVGWHPGFHGGGTTGVNQHIGTVAAAAADGAGWQSGGSGYVTTDITLGAVQNAAQLEIYFLYGYPISGDRFTDVKVTAEDSATKSEAVAAAVVAAQGVAGTEYMGAFNPTTAGAVASGAGTYMLADTYDGAGARTIDSYFDTFKVATNAAGSGRLGLWKRIGSDNFEIDAIDVTWPSSGVTTFTEGVTAGWTTNRFPPVVGQFLGLWHDGSVVCLTSTPNPGYYFNTGKVNRFNKASPNSTTIEIQAKATVRNRSVSLPSTVSLPLPQEWDLWLIIGQSNHWGNATVYGTTPVAGTALNWRVSTQTLVNLADPTGNSGSPKGSQWPAFCTERFNRTGRGQVIVNMAKSGSSLVAGQGGAAGDWSASGTLRAAAITEYTACIAALNAAGYAWQPCGVIGVSMESDAISIDTGIGEAVDGSAYYTELGTLRTYLETNTGMGSEMPWIIQELGRLAAGNTTTGITAIRAKQRLYCRSQANTFLGWTGAKTLSARGLMEADNLHWGQTGQTEAGKSTAVLTQAIGGFA